MWPMRISELLLGHGTLKIDAEIILCEALQRERSWLFAHESEKVGEEIVEHFHAAMERRRSGEPLAYITGKKEFYGRTFLVNSDVLIPRPSTEALIQSAIEYLERPQNQRKTADSGIVIMSHRFSNEAPKAILDVGTGSGIIAITMMLEGWAGVTIAVDSSEAALRVAQRNAKKFGTHEKVTWRHQDGIESAHSMTMPFLLMSNPPYIPSDESLMKEVVDHEPNQALFAGDDGMAVIKPLVLTAKNNPRCTGIILELREDQYEEVRSLLEA